MWADTILILFISICTALLGEGNNRTNVLINTCSVLINSEEEMQNNIYVHIVNIMFRIDVVDGIPN